MGVFFFLDVDDRETERERASETILTEIFTIITADTMQDILHINNISGQKWANDKDSLTPSHSHARSFVHSEEKREKKKKKKTSMNNVQNMVHYTGV